MDSDCDSLAVSNSTDTNFGFAFNERSFSDRVLRLEILANKETRVSECRSAASLPGSGSMRRKLDSGCYARTDHALKIDNQPVGHILDLKSGFGCGVDSDNHADFPLIEDSPLGDENLDSDDSDCSEDGPYVLRVETLHISSIILASKSPFFYKMLSNGSDQSEVTLRVSESEAEAVREIVSFVYTNTLSSDSSFALLSVLIAADKFEVASCVRHCCRLLKNLPMTPMLALLYLDLPSHILMPDSVKLLTDAAKQFLISRYKHMLKHHDELMTLSLAGVEAILSSSELQVASEDAVFDFVLKWARNHYPDAEQRRNILSSSCLGRHIRFQYMSPGKLRKVLSCTDFDNDFISKAVLDALFFKVEARHQRAQPSEEASSTVSHYMERDYKYRPIKVVGFKHPRPQCVVYLSLKREECSKLFPSGHVYSQAFHLEGQGFFLSAHCNMDQQRSLNSFGLFLGKEGNSCASLSVDYEFSARMNPTEEFFSKYKGNHTFTGGKAVGYRNLFSIPWTSFIAEDSSYFINGVLYLRAVLTIRRENS